MQQVSSSFLAEIAKSHTVFSYADLVTPNGQSQRLTITAGSVTIDQTASVRRTCSLTALDPTGTLTPLSSTSPLAPYGSELKLYRGVKYTSGQLSGTTEVVPLGTYRISDASTQETVSGVAGVKIQAYDLSRTISRDAFTEPYTISSGTNLVDAIKALVSRTVPGVVFDAFSSSATMSADTTYDSSTNPWTVIGDLATAAACEAFFTATNSFRIAPPIDIDHLPAPAYSYVKGETCTMEELDVDFTDEPGYNGVIVIGQSTGTDTAPVRSVVWDDTPSSPTYYLGSYGKVPQIIDNSNVSAQSDADAAAKAALNLVLGFISQLTVTATVNPALDVDDVIQVTSAESGVNATYAIQAVSIPLDGATSMSITLRQKRVT